jgi:hypothetical protein
MPIQVVDATASNTVPGWNFAFIDTGGIDAGGTGAFGLASVASASDLRLTITMVPTSDQSAAPTLIQWELKSDCVPSE